MYIEYAFVARILMNKLLKRIVFGLIITAVLAVVYYAFISYNKSRNYYQVREGMHENEVIALVGAPKFTHMTANMKGMPKEKMNITKLSSWVSSEATMMVGYDRDDIVCLIEIDEGGTRQGAWEWLKALILR